MDSAPVSTTPSHFRPGALTLSVFALAAVGVVALVYLGMQSGPASSSGAAQPAAPAVTALAPKPTAPHSMPGVGDVIDASAYQLVITKVTQGETMNSSTTFTAPAGSIFVVIEYAIHNISNAAISERSLPHIVVVDPDGTYYEANSNASALYAMAQASAGYAALERGGVRRAADVFIVPSSAFDPDTWSMSVGDGGPSVNFRRVTANTPKWAQAAIVPESAAPATAEASRLAPPTPESPAQSPIDQGSQEAYAANNPGTNP